MMNFSQTTKLVVLGGSASAAAFNLIDVADIVDNYEFLISMKMIIILSSFRAVG